MVKKQRRMRTALRAASKVQERELQATAEKLAEDPSPLIPVCHGHGSHFRKAQKAIGKVWGVRDDLKKLAKLTKRGHPLGRAFAATLLVGQSRDEDEQVIMLQVKTPFGTVPVASRGKAKRDHLVGVQYYDDRKLRLLLVFDLVKRKRLAFYSMPDGGIACGGKRAKPPPEFVEAEAKSLGLLKDPEGWGCAHAIHAGERLTLRWKPAGVSLRKCAACATEGNTLLTITRHIAARGALEGFEVAVDLEPLPTQGSQPVDLPASTPLDAAALERYRKGELDDAGLLDAQRAARIQHLRGLPGPLYYYNGASYGKDAEAFLAALAPTALEGTALRAALQGHDKAVVVERGSASKLLAELWPDRGLAALEAVAGSPAVAKDIFDAHDVGAKGVGPALQQAQARGQRHATDSELPAYRDLPAGARLADQVARTFRAHGKAAALAALDQSEDPALKGLVHAFELALGAGQGKAWKYAPLDVELAQQLKPHVAALLNADAKGYHAALQSLARATGSTAELRKA